MPKYIKFPRRNYIDENYFSPPVGMCDTTGLMVYRPRLLRQLVQAGDSVTWEGNWVAPEYYDPLDQQKKTPPVKGDPTPVKDPRPLPAAPPIDPSLPPPV